MKILTLHAENVKRLRAVDITPTDDVVVIAGANGAGKTSVLDSIWWALAGVRSHQEEPIRRGATAATISLDLGAIKVRRLFKSRNGNPVATHLYVESAEGARFPSPQKMLDELVGSLSFDPLAFSRLPPRGQLEVLRGFVTGTDFEAEAGAEAAEFARRRDLNRSAKEARARMEGVDIPADIGAPPNAAELTEELSAARKQNQDREKVIRFQGAVERRMWAADQRVKDAEAALARAREAQTEARTAFDNLAEPPAAQDEEAILAKLQGAQAILRAHDARRLSLARRDEERGRMEAAQTEADALTASMRARKARLAKAVADAEMPVPGLTLAPDSVQLNGVPLDQASDAEQLRLSCAIAMAQNARLRVLRVRDGSLLDDTSMKILRAMAAERDYQVWIERVDTSGKVGVVIADGRVAGFDAEGSAPLPDARHPAPADA